MGTGSVGSAQLTPLAMNVPGHASGWRFVSEGKYFTCASHTDDSVWCWGENDGGEAAQGNFTNPQTTPAQVGTGSNWQTVVAGRFHACARRADATLWCWGDNQVGSVGVPGMIKYDTPQHVISPSSWSTVAPMNTSVCAFDATTQLYCWGDNTFGSLGLGDTVDRATPTLVTLP